MSLLDTDYANVLKEAAVSLYEFSNNYRGSYSECYPNARNYYGYSCIIIYSVLYSLVIPNSNNLNMKQTKLTTGIDLKITKKRMYLKFFA